MVDGNKSQVLIKFVTRLVGRVKIETKINKVKLCCVEERSSNKRKDWVVYQYLVNKEIHRNNTKTRNG